MTIYIKLHESLKREENKSDVIEVNLAEPSTLIQFAQALGIHHKEIGLLTINVSFAKEQICLSGRFRLACSTKLRFLPP